MKFRSRFVITLFACVGLALIANAGPEQLPQSYKESKEVVQPVLPTCCDWKGFYLGLHAGGQFGHSESDLAVDEIDFDHAWGYSESGFVGGGQVGYNWQWRWLVLGAESDFGYMNLDGHGNLLHRSDVPAESDSDFYATFRGRLGFAHDCWLFYATGGAIGVNYEIRSVLEPDPELFNPHKQDFDWGYTVGGGIERKIGCHWSIKVEYLYFALDDQSTKFVSIQSQSDSIEPRFLTGDGRRRRVFDFSGETTGHILRAGLNFHF